MELPLLFALTFAPEQAKLALFTDFHLFAACAMSMPNITPSTENGNLSISRAAFVHEAELKRSSDYSHFFTSQVDLNINVTLALVF